MAKGKFVKKTVPKTTTNITQGIVNQIKADGWSASRINTMGVYDEKLGRYRRSGSRKGFLDVAACINGIFVVIDVKNDETSDRLSTEQGDFIKEVIDAGGITFAADNIEHFNQWYFNELPKLIDERICLTFHAITKVSE